MRTKPREKDHGIDTLKNAGYAFKLMTKASPLNIPVVTLSKTIYVFISQYVNSVLFLKKLLEVLTGSRDFHDFMSLLFLFTGGSLLAYLISNLGDYVYYVGEKKAFKSLNEILFEKASTVDIECFENPKFYDIYKRASEVISDAKYSLFNGQIANIISYLITGVFLFGYVSTVDLKILVILVLCFISFLIEFKINKLFFERENSMTENRRKKAYVQRVIFLRDYAKDIRTSDIYQVMNKRLTEATEDNIKIIEKYGKKMVFYRIISLVLGNAIPIAGTFSYAAYCLMVTKTLNIADFSVLLTAVTTIKSFMLQISDSISTLQTATFYFGNFKKFMEYESHIKNGKRKLKKLRTIEFQNVSFTYPDAKKPSLKNVSLKIDEGETVAIVGKNGAGKSTFVKLLLRFYDPDEGRILCNGIDLREYDIDDFRDKIGTVFQDYKVFSLTVNENVLCRECRTEEDRSLAETSLKNSGAYEKVKTLPKQAETILTREFDDEGAGLSGGEMQKIAAARMFAHPFDLAVLDEPSSALDPIAEYKMYNQLLQATKNKTVIYISHRLSSATLSDKIFVFDQAKIIESGNHEDLMKQNGFYAEMFHMQASNYQ